MADGTADLAKRMDFLILDVNPKLFSILFDSNGLRYLYIEIDINKKPDIMAKISIQGCLINTY